MLQGCKFQGVSVVDKDDEDREAESSAERDEEEAKPPSRKGRKPKAASRKPTKEEKSLFETPPVSLKSKEVLLELAPPFNKQSTRKRAVGLVKYGIKKNGSSGDGGQGQQTIKDEYRGKRTYGRNR